MASKLTAAFELDEDCFRCMSIPKRQGWCESASGVALRQQVGVLMLIAKKAFGRGVFLNEGQVPGYAEARFAPSSEKFIGLVPA